MKKTECRNVLEEVLMGTRANTRGASHGSSFVIFRFTQHTARNPENLQRNKGDSLPSDRDLLSGRGVGRCVGRGPSSQSSAFGIWFSARAAFVGCDTSHVTLCEPLRYFLLSLGCWSPLCWRGGRREVQPHQLDCWGSWGEGAGKHLLPPTPISQELLWGVLLEGINRENSMQEGPGYEPQISQSRGDGAGLQS